MNATVSFSRDVLRIDARAVVGTIAAAIRHQVGEVLRRRGAVVGLSGGVDSSVCAALCVRALGKDRVLGLLMPEGDSPSDSANLGRLVAGTLGMGHLLEDISPILDAAGCYRRQMEAIRAVFPEYGAGWKCKVTIPPILEGERLTVMRLTVESPDGVQRTERMPLNPYLELIAATNWKQRIRAAMEYYHADRLNYAVCGTPNRLEYDQGFFVKNGDGSADFKPIAHLYKTQVYMLAAELALPKDILSQTPTTGTYSLPQTQEEFFFGLPYERMDLCLYGADHKVPAADVARAVGLTPEQVGRVYRDIDSKHRGTRYLHLPPLLVEPIRHPEDI